MITELHIQNFKSHRDTLLTLKPLTLLTGVNGSGKSSIIQSLLLLRQSYKKQQLSKALILNDVLCSLGTGKDAIYQSAKEDFLHFSFKIGQIVYKWNFASNESKDFLPTITKGVNSLFDLAKLSLFNNNFQYLSAGRLPEFKYLRNDLMVENERQLSLKNGYGELVAQFLFHYGEKEKVISGLRNENNKFEELIHQVTAWEREISPNVNVIPKKVGDNYSIYYSFDRNAGLGSTDEFKSENVAYGLTYALPVITALLSAKKDALILIENPEAHLHPRGQSKLAELIALAAQNGIQIIVETHSDHIINGILVACKKFESKGKGIDRNNTKLFYFGAKDEQYAATCENVIILEGGKIDKQPEGFFDQLQNDLSVIMGF